MTARRNESVRRIVGAGKGTVREHIAVEVIAYGVAVERDQLVIRIIRKGGICRATCNITCGIVSKRFGRNDRIRIESVDAVLFRSSTISPAAIFSG